MAAALMVCLVSLPVNITAQTRPGQQEPAEVVRVFTQLVQTDVMVFDKQGHFVDKLRKEDFELRIDGKVRPIEFFERVTVGSINEESQLSAARGTQPSSGTSPVGPIPLDRGRTIFFYVDDLHLGQSSLGATRKLITDFIEKEMNQNDEAAISSASGQIGFLQQLTDSKTVLRAALQRLKVRSFSTKDFERPPMTEYQALLIDREDTDVKEYFIEEVLRQNPMLSRESAENIVRGRATTILQQAANITRNTLIGLEGLVKSSRKLPGRKLVFFISDGFLLDNRNSDSFERLQRITSDAARSGVVIYSLDSRGLVASLADASSAPGFDPSGRLERASHGELHATQDPLNALAKDTGGRPVFNTNALEVGVSRALKESSVYYLLAWKPEREASSSSKFRRIEVRLLEKPDLAVRVRRGFYDVEPAPAANKAKNQKPPQTPQVQLREAIGAPYPDRSIPIALSVNYISTPDQKMLLSTSLQIAAEFISFGPENGKHTAAVQITGLVFNDRGQPGARFEERLTLTAASSSSMKELNESIAYTYPVTTGPGLYQVRVAARDEKSGRTGSAHAWIEIPDLSDRKLRLSSLIIGWQKQGPATSVSNNDPPAPAQAGLSIDHQFQRNSVLRFLFVVYNAARAPADSQPDVASQVQILRDNQPVITTTLKKIPTAGMDLDRLPYAADLSLSGLPAGQYVIQVTAIDRVSKTSALQQTRFAID
jgi:VWFA-related protein